MKRLSDKPTRSHSQLITFKPGQDYLTSLFDAQGTPLAYFSTCSVIFQSKQSQKFYLYYIIYTFMNT